MSTSVVGGRGCLEVAPLGDVFCAQWFEMYGFLSGWICRGSFELLSGALRSSAESMGAEMS